MKHRRIHFTAFLVTAFSFSMLLLAGNLVAQQAGPGNNRSIDSNKARVVEYWTSERRASAIPRDLVIDARGLGYLRRPDGSLQPYGHQIVAENTANSPTPNAKPPGAGGGGSDHEPPVISDMDPDGTTIDGTYTFSATITDESAIKIVYFTIIYPNGFTTQTFQALAGAGDTWYLNLVGFFDGNWQWYVVAKDNTKRGGNSVASPIVPFTVDTGGGGEPPPVGDDDTVTNEEWTAGGDDNYVQKAAGRLYFEMPKNAKWKGPWGAFVCSGTTVTDNTAGRSVILTAAHCVYDDVNKAFARNVLFIPNQAGTSGSGTDLNCGNDPLGCWAPSYGVVDVNWTTTTFPNNIPWDYAYYVVDDTGAHDPGFTSSSDSLDVAAGALRVSFSTPQTEDGDPGAHSIDFTHALGYSYSEDPKLMYCAEDMTTEGPGNWWLPSCGLSGGSSGGPWVQRMDIALGSGPVISVNSWGYSNSPGMAGPKLSGTSAECVFTMAILDSPALSGVDGEAGTTVVCPP
jgi:hypothetical protein